LKYAKKKRRAKFCPRPDRTAGADLASEPRHRTVPWRVIN
jgi:hypothetical protein